jgi:hypothetical protein
MAAIIKGSTIRNERQGDVAGVQYRSSEKARVFPRSQAPIPVSGVGPATVFEIWSAEFMDKCVVHILMVLIGLRLSVPFSRPVRSDKTCTSSSAWQLILVRFILFDYPDQARGPNIPLTSSQEVKCSDVLKI